MSHRTYPRASMSALNAIERMTCCWPDCGADRNAALELPVCTDHALRVFGRVSEVARASLRPAPLDEPPVTERQGFVYFARFGDRIKIGFTTNLKQRMVDIPHDEVLAVQPGTFQDEKRCHLAFAHLRETGEWFRAESDLLAFIAGIQP